MPWHSAGVDQKVNRAKVIAVTYISVYQTRARDNFSAVTIQRMLHRIYSDYVSTIHFVLTYFFTSGSQFRTYSGNNVELDQYKVGKSITKRSAQTGRVNVDVLMCVFNSNCIKNSLLYVGVTFELIAILYFVPV